MVISFALPWWVGDFHGGQMVSIFGWGLRHNLKQLSSFIEADVTPIYQIVIAWLYVAINVILAMFITWRNPRKGQWVLFGTGIVYMLYAAVAIHIVVANRITQFQSPIPLQGSVNFGGIGTGVAMITSLQPGYYLAYVVGSLFIILAIVQIWINKKSIFHQRINCQPYI